MQYQVNRPNVVHETIDGETVIINLKSGTYYSLNEAATQILAALEKGVSVSSLVEGLNGGAVDAESIEQFLRELIDENLVRPAEAASDAAATDMPLELASAPVLSKFTDMEEFLLLDPIHEVDETGWPNVKRDQPMLSDAAATQSAAESAEQGEE